MKSKCLVVIEYKSSNKNNISFILLFFKLDPSSLFSLIFSRCCRQAKYGASADSDSFPFDSLRLWRMVMHYYFLPLLVIIALLACRTWQMYQGVLDDGNKSESPASSGFQDSFTLAAGSRSSLTGSKLTSWWTILLSFVF